VPTNADIIMLDLYTQPSFRRMIDDATIAGHILLSEVVESTFISSNIETLDKDPLRAAHPRSFAAQPIFEKFGRKSESAVVGFLFSVVPWDTYFRDILPVGTNGFVVKIMDSCGTNFAYLLNGPDANYLGEQYEPDSKYDYLVQTSEFASFARFNEANTNAEEILYCSYSLSVHATSAYEDEYTSNKPLWVTLVVLMVFLFTALVFVLYDFFVQRRQTKVLKTAQKTTAIVTSLFPKSVIKKMMEADNDVRSSIQISGKDKLKSFFDGSGEEDSKHLKGEEAGTTIFKTKPIAGTWISCCRCCCCDGAISVLFPRSLLSVRLVGLTLLCPQIFSPKRPSCLETLSDLRHGLQPVSRRRYSFCWRQSIMNSI
jgi:hypothetical protein